VAVFENRLHTVLRRSLGCESRAILGKMAYISTSGWCTAWHPLIMSEENKKRKQVTLEKESIFIVDLRDNFSHRTYIFDFDETDVHLRVWTALMALKADGKFYFPNVGDIGYQDLVPDAADRQSKDHDFHDFFEVAMQDEQRFPRAGDTATTKQKCSWMVYLVEELRQSAF